MNDVLEKEGASTLNAAVMGAPIRLRGRHVQAMDEEEFACFCHENEDLRIEREPDKTITIMSPTFSFTGRVNLYLSAQVANWIIETGCGQGFDSSSGFTLPDGSIRSPDCSYVSNERWQNASVAEQKRFMSVVPDFVVELKSESDGWEASQAKMRAYIDNGVRLGWLFFVEKETVLVYREGHAPATVEGYNKALDGGDVLPGFSFDLARFKAYIEG